MSTSPPVSSVQWVKCADRFPTEDQFVAGILFAVKWPEGKVEMTSWQDEYRGNDYRLMEQHFSCFIPPASSGEGYWCLLSEIAP